MAILGWLLSPIGRWVGVVLLIWAALFLYGKHKDGEGYDRCTIEWKEAEKAAQTLGRAASDGAARDVRDGVQDPFDRDDN